MKKYYLHNGTKEQGPYSIAELKSKNISPKTKVWQEGLTEWIEAENIDELKVLFPKAPPPINQKKNLKPTKSRSKKIFSKVALIIGAIVFIYGIVSVASNSSYNDSNYYENKMTIEEIEKSNPLKFLSFDGSYNESFWGTEFKVKGKVVNNATLASYKDLVIRVTHFSKTKSVINTEDYTIYEVFKPNKATPLNLDFEKYKNVETIKIDVVDAKPVY